MQPIIIDPRFRLAYVLVNHKGDLHILLGIVSLLLSLGFFFGTGTSLNYELLYHFISQTTWGIVFLVYSFIKTLGAFYKIPNILRLLNGIVGIWAWSYVFLSFTVFDPTALAPTELMLAAPILVEFWNLLELPYPEKLNKLLSKRIGYAGT